jgi:tRNA nucleotidyltransferase (CCA-adding enzyme)
MTTPESLKWLEGAAPHLTLAEMHKDGRLAQLLPEVEALYGIPQHASYHPEIDTGRHMELTMQAAELLTSNPKVRFAALVHDLGKALTAKDLLPAHVGHETAGLEPVRKVCRRLGVPEDWTRLALLVCQHHLSAHIAFEMSEAAMVRFFSNTGLDADEELFEQFILAVGADKRGREGRLDTIYKQGVFLREVFKCLSAMQMPSGETYQTELGSIAHAQRVSALKKLRELRTA